MSGSTDSPGSADARVRVSVVIKALNEARHVERAVASARAALAAVDGRGEIVLADSRSDDATVDIALAAGASVARLADGEARSCGTGPQLGYQHTCGAYVCLMDGDMEIDPGFLPEALAFLAANPAVAGVGGGVRDVNVVNLEFRRRALRGAVDLVPGEVDRLSGGGLYRRAAVESVGHFSDRNLHGHEEFDLGVRLRAAGWGLHRLPIPFVDHHGHVLGGYRLLWRRIRSRYLDGSGEVLRAAIGRPHLRAVLRDLPELRLWTAVLLGWCAAAAALAIMPGIPMLGVIGLALAVLPVAAMSLRYRSLPLGLYAVVAWNAHAFGMLRGVLAPRRPPGERIASVLVDGCESPGAADRSPAPLSGVATLLLLLGLLLGSTLPTTTAPRAAEWVPVRDTSLAVRPGSPLDLGGLGRAGAAGERGRVIAGPNGQLALDTDPNAPARFLCASLAWGPASGSYPDHATADRYAEQLRIHSYDLARFHFTDAILMAGRREDFSYDPVQLDRFRYLLAALKRNGLYWIIDGMTSQAGGLGGVEDRWDGPGDLKLLVHVDDRARAHWRRIVSELYGTVNPYTGVAPLQDPALALVILVNENAVEFGTILAEKRAGRPYPAVLEPGFNRWLARAYGSTAALRRRWPDLRGDERIEEASVRLPDDRESRGLRMLDAQTYFRTLEADTAAWMEADLRGLGYPGLVTAYNNRLSAATNFSRMRLPATAMDTYHDEVLSFAPGTAIKGTSSLTGGAAYLRELVGTRWLDRPFVVAEYDHLFWNPHRYEAGLVFPAYAALQGWSAICRHGAGPIDLTFLQPWPHKRAILPYGIGLDPVARAGETLAALLYRRGDVATARGAVAIPFGRPGDMWDSGLGTMPDAATRLGLLVRVGLLPFDRRPLAGAVVLPVEQTTSPARLAGAAPTTGPDAERTLADDGTFAGHVRGLRAMGLLSAENRTDPATGIDESETGEIVLRESDRTATIVTARTEAAAFAGVATPLRLGAVTVEGASEAALVAVSALDGAMVASSRRLLLIFATDARNTGMTFRDAEERTIETFGRMPVLIRRGSIRIRVSGAGAGGWRLTSLHLDGSPGDVLANGAPGTEIVARIDNAAPRHGPTTFFLIERDP